MDDILFLSIGEVVEIHKDQVERYGGHPGIHDNELLCSAVAGPEATFSGEYLNIDLFEMAAAYIFYICRDHPFVDGNKRTALATGLVFLELNGVTITDSKGILYAAVMELVARNIGKANIAALLRSLQKN
ncbi:type II toxin-antitoxin system death-on-curing family toxin [Syntrophomonas wolfei]|jgi:death-on-curing protein|uniref:type II toxin-antitoxin system death-on-curing family toxin n=1 Tax=Syntrophomonas wolfei TaxID=863 RepID=UPI00077467DF|nr:type II toxin-antitoxin system death-on-curing family toxin [Syntrophomonas wolfei]